MAEPEKSLLLVEADRRGQPRRRQALRHGLAEYRAILSWIRSGAPFGREPRQTIAWCGSNCSRPWSRWRKASTADLLVTAHFADGRTEDFTDQALFDMNDREVANVDRSGGRSRPPGRDCRVGPGRGSGGERHRRRDRPADGSDIRRFARINFIDDFVFDKLRRFRIAPSELSSDCEFLRRVCLDLTGTLPPPERVREFLASKDPQKREKLIDALIGSPEFVDYWTFRFDDLFRVSVFANGMKPKWSQMYGSGFATISRHNKPYDQMARERIAARGLRRPVRGTSCPTIMIGPPGETMAEEVRVFLGRRLDCAQCHNHPYENWSQDQFWGLAAFFGAIVQHGRHRREYVIFDHPLDRAMGNGDVNGSLEAVPSAHQSGLKPTLLDGTVIESSGRENPRKELADWMVTHPYFAEAAVNRIWGYFFGRGIVDPVDDFRSTNPPTHPELLARWRRTFGRTITICGI